MPRGRGMCKMGMACRHRRLMGGSIREKLMHWAKKAATFAHRNQLLSRGANLLAPHAGKYSTAFSNIGRVSNALGYGRHRMRHGRGLRLAGT